MLSVNLHLHFINLLDFWGPSHGPVIHKPASASVPAVQEIRPACVGHGSRVANGNHGKPAEDGFDRNHVENLMIYFTSALVNNGGLDHFAQSVKNRFIKSLEISCNLIS